MKFGKNLAHLSIPEWKVYNLDYNDLKASIRDVTQAESTDLSLLYQKFTDNFDYLNLFVLTKTGEIVRILQSAIAEFDVIKASNESSVTRLGRLSTLHYSIINNISIELRKLTKFILVQKIAVKKILKKFAKHYHDKSLSKPFISSLMHMLQSNERSFVNMDLSHLTSALLTLLRNIERELKLAHELVHRRPPSLAHMRKSHSVSTIKTAGSSIFSDSTTPEDVNLDVNFDLSIDPAGKFDLITMVKKNFALHALVAKDVASTNDLNLSVDVYLNIPKLGDAQRVNMICLTNSPDDINPSWIMSYENSPVSVVMAYTGGLRKYSYCCIPRTVVETLLLCLGSQDQEIKTLLTQKVKQYVAENNLLMMTKLTINSLISGSLQPSLQVICDRKRHYLHKDSTQNEELVEDVDDNISISPGADETGLNSTAPSTVDTKVYEDTFYMTFDENIYTSNEPPTRITFGTSNMDAFPFNRFSIFSNDSNLHVFESSLRTTLEDNVLRNSFKAIALKKLPVKIQNFIKNSSVYLFKGFSLFDYMRSCYFNVIPAEPNNHYSRLLSINLFKNYENVEIVNTQDTVDQNIIQDKARTILKRQMSCKSLQETTLDKVSKHNSETRALTSEHTEHFRKWNDQVPTPKPYADVSEGMFRSVTNLDNLDEEDEEEDSYFVYLQFNSDLEDNLLNSSILSFIKIKHRIRRAFRAFNLLAIDLTPWKLNREKYSNDLESNPLNYDSINEDLTFFNTVNDYQLQLIEDYDHVLSIIYFTLCFSSLFISGINLGIVFSLNNLQNSNTNFSILDNPLVSVILTFGFLFAMVFSMTSINLTFQRFRPSPAPHFGIIWAVFTMVTVTVIWTLFMVAP